MRFSGGILTWNKVQTTVDNNFCFMYHKTFTVSPFLINFAKDD